MSKKIEAIFLDVGNTLRILTPRPEHQLNAKKRMAELVGTEEDPELFCEKLDQRYKEYRKWAFAELKEAPEAELWTRWLAYDFPAEKIAPLGVELTYQYRQSMGYRVVVPDGKEVVIELHNRGYTMGMISNLITSQEIPDWLEADGLTPYFKSVMLSSVLGIRKPDPKIYWEGARKAGVKPENCVYVGDNLKRDVTGTKAAGFGMTVIIITPEKLKNSVITEENKPDAIIHEFKELLGIFPGYHEVNWENVKDVKITNQP